MDDRGGFPGIRRWGDRVQETLEGPTNGRLTGVYRRRHMQKLKTLRPFASRRGAVKFFGDMTSQTEGTYVEYEESTYAILFCFAMHIALNVLLFPAFPAKHDSPSGSDDCATNSHARKITCQFDSSLGLETNDGAELSVSYPRQKKSPFFLNHSGRKVNLSICRIAEKSCYTQYCCPIFYVLSPGKT